MDVAIATWGGERWQCCSLRLFEEACQPNGKHFLLLLRPPTPTSTPTATATLLLLPHKQPYMTDNNSNDQYRHQLIVQPPAHRLGGGAVAASASPRSLLPSCCSRPPGSPGACLALHFSKSALIFFLSRLRPMNTIWFFISVSAGQAP